MEKLFHKIFILVMMGLSFYSCSTAGPFVTNVSSDGDGNLNIEKCTVQFNGFTGVISNKDCTNSKVKVSK